MSTTDQLRHWWRAFECNEDKLNRISYFDDSIRVARGTENAWEALEKVMTAHGYQVRNKDTDSYNCRAITGGTKKSLHSYGIALDVNWNTNPYKDHSGIRDVVFSDKSTQAQRAEDVHSGKADTDMSAGMIADILSIKTIKGLTVFEWGGTWNGVKDAMHFEIDISPSQLEEGIDWGTVTEAIDHPVDIIDLEGIYLRVTARNGLRLRTGPGTDFDINELVQFGEIVRDLGHFGDWVKISLQDDTEADGHMHSAFLESVPTIDLSPSLATLGHPKFSIDAVKTLFTASASDNVEKYFPFVYEALKENDLSDTEMVCMALGTIKAETAGFVPISEYKSKYNTKYHSFDLYETGTPKGNILGNTKKGDGKLFKGRGFIQLTGRFNYTNIGLKIGEDLINNPELANDPEIASRILSRYLKYKEDRIRRALDPTQEDLKKARKLVNGGTHGFDRFSDAYRGGRKLFG